MPGRVTGTAAFRAAELAAVARCALDDPGGAEQALRAAGPSRGSVRELAPLYDLLADPPLPGIDRLRAIDAFLSERTWASHSAEAV